MRCDCCNRRLNDYECSLKHAELGCYMNTCVKCLDGLGIPVKGRTELAPKVIVEDVADDILYDNVAERQYYRDVQALIYDDNFDEN